MPDTSHSHFVGVFSSEQSFSEVVIEIAEGIRNAVAEVDYISVVVKVIFKG